MYRWEDGKFSSATSGLSSACGNKCTDINDFELTRSKWVNDKYKKFYEEKGYLPKYFDVYNGTEVKDFAPTISTRSNGAMGSGTLLVYDNVNFNLPSIQNVTYENDVQRVGTVSENSLIGGRVIEIEGICFTLMACTHGYGMGNIYDNRKLVLDEKFRKYTKWIDFCWWYR